MLQLGFTPRPIECGEGSRPAGQVITRRRLEPTLLCSLESKFPHRDVTDLDSTGPGELDDSAVALILIKGHSPAGAVRPGDHLDASIFEVWGVNTTAEFEGGFPTIDGGDHKRRVVHVGYGEHRRVFLSALLRYQDIPARVPRESQVGPSRHPLLDPDHHSVLDARRGGQMGQLVEPFLGNGPTRHQKPLL
jgi:hypothetical protein